MRNVLVTWIGNTDLRAPKEADVVGVGPIAQALDARAFDEALLLSDHPELEVAAFIKWLRHRTSTSRQAASEKLSGPT
ncbi:MAG: AAA family ATPase, partial [Acidobacteria bacterium]|nr:AAA family ATPase [Acidobacteriota bacterium]